jgi:hypothetical protein
MYAKLISLLSAGAIVASVGGVANAAQDAKSLTGSWSGTTSQDISLTEEEWSVRITVTALNGRLAGIYTTARVECPGPEVADIRVLKSFRQNGPRLVNGRGFAVRVNGVSISGVLGAGAASGHFDIAKGGCSGKGTWKAKRVL